MPPDTTPPLARHEVELFSTRGESRGEGLDNEVVARLDVGAVDAASVARPLIERATRAVAPLLPRELVDLTVDRVDARTNGLGPLQPLLADERVTEIMVNAGADVWVEREGALERVPLALDEHEVLLVLERIVAPLGLSIDRANPVVDARLPDGSRVHAIVPPLAVDGPCLTIRRFGARRIPLGAMCSPGIAQLLRWAVRGRLNLLVSGGAGAGKTTLLNALAAEVPASERVVTVEDAAELRLPLPHVVRLEARPPNADGIGAFRVRELVRNALRMRPDRIIVGEIRGGEAIDMLQAMNTGHDGSLSTCHANAPADAVRRVETLALMGDVALPLAAIREQIGSAIDLVVHLNRLHDGQRLVVAIAELVPGRAGAGEVTARPLAIDGRLLDLPTRPARVGMGLEPPDPAWVER